METFKLNQAELRRWRDRLTQSIARDEATLAHVEGLIFQDTEFLKHSAKENQSK